MKLIKHTQKDAAIQFPDDITKLTTCCYSIELKLFQIPKLIELKFQYL